MTDNFQEDYDAVEFSEWVDRLYSSGTKALSKRIADFRAGVCDPSVVVPKYSLISFDDWCHKLTVLLEVGRASIGKMIASDPCHSDSSNTELHIKFLEAIVISPPASAHENVNIVSYRSSAPTDLDRSTSSLNGTTKNTGAQQSPRSSKRASTPQSRRHSSQPSMRTQDAASVRYGYDSRGDQMPNANRSSAALQDDLTAIADLDAIDEGSERSSNEATEVGQVSQVNALQVNPSDHFVPASHAYGQSLP